MKNLISALLSIIFIYTIDAQERHIAYLKTSKIESIKKIRGSNIHESLHKKVYQNAITSINSGKIIRELQKDIMTFNIKTSSIFDDSEVSTYNVSFKRKQSKASVVYNNSGEILSSKEVYYDVNLPLELRTKILSKYPNNTLLSNKVKYLYNKNHGLNIIYKVWIKNEKRKVPLIFDANFETIL
ncbi:hypothetical protein EYD45_00200 [Hyunsoonleella flava]|uniref:Nicotinate-nucleotide adenylyltransferase n=1 Tax=Hyunsoonleella flava TaxID=2527939 RepID=A0A4Q9FFY9_9FLAO|nr:hypothetical protein [Hyunsoonleella flava]TBN06343.1 hypothetical protein EYD45_00200 [Hyunsoonleella flava]